ncbi:MAG TPA: hypothetical protein VF177_12525 [Anaerolineae bacterium]
MLTQNMRRRTFSDTRLSFRLKYPETTPQGHAVKIKEASVRGGIKAHFVSEDSQELYFEVIWYPGLAPEEGYERLKEDVEKRFEELDDSELQESRLGSLPVFAFSFSWPERERTVIFIPRRQAMYRILYDPRSPLNLHTLSTVELL